MLRMQHQKLQLMQQQQQQRLQNDMLKQQQNSIYSSNFHGANSPGSPTDGRGDSSDDIGSPSSGPSKKKSRYTTTIMMTAASAERGAGDKL